MARNIGGESVTAIAAAEGLSRDWVGKELRSPESRQIILRLVERHHIRIERLFVTTLDAIDAAFKAQRTVHFMGGRVSLGPDHYARLTAAKRYLEVVSLGRPVAQAQDGAAKVGMTYDELCRRVAESEKTDVIQ